MELTDFLWFKVMRAFWNSSASCSPYSHALMYSIFVTTILISVGGFFVWRRFIRMEPDLILSASV